MSLLDGEAGFWLLRLCGALAGTLVSLVYMMPGDRREALSRLAGGLISGLVFGAPAGIYLAGKLGIADALSAHEIVLSGTATVSLTAWWALGILERAARKWVERELGGEGDK